MSRVEHAISIWKKMPKTWDFGGAFIFGAEKHRYTDGEEASLSVETMEKDDLQKCFTRFNIYIYILLI